MPLITTTSAASARGFGFGRQQGPRTAPIAGYELWLDSSDASTFTYSSGSVISRWTDKSANAYQFEPATTTNAPGRTGTQNSKSTVVFDGTNDFLTSTSATSAWKFLSDGTQSTVIIVYKNTRVPTGTQDANALLSTVNDEFATINAGSQGYILKSEEILLSGTYYSYNDTSVNNGTIPSGQTYVSYANVPGYIDGTLHNTFNVYTGFLDLNNATASQRMKVYNSQWISPNSVMTGSSYNGWTGPSASNPGSPLRIGWEKLNSYYESFKGEVAEIIMYKRILSDSERTEMTTYLKSKWNV